MIVDIHLENIPFNYAPIITLINFDNIRSSASIYRGKMPY